MFCVERKERKWFGQVTGNKQSIHSCRTFECRYSYSVVAILLMNLIVDSVWWTK